MHPQACLGPVSASTSDKRTLFLNGPKWYGVYIFNLLGIHIVYLLQTIVTSLQTFRTDNYGSFGNFFIHSSPLRNRLTSIRYLLLCLTTWVLPGGSKQSQSPFRRQNKCSPFGPNTHFSPFLPGMSSTAQLPGMTEVFRDGMSIAVPST